MAMTTNYDWLNQWRRRTAALLAALFVLTMCSMGGTRAALLQGCDFGDELCEPDEVCVPDGLFGQCYSDAESALIRPLILDQPLSAFQSEVLRAELSRLAANGLDWPDARAQCVLAYFKLAVAFQLNYDTEFCTVRNPANIWALVQRVQNALLAEEEQRTSETEQQLPQDEQPSLLMANGDGEDGTALAGDEQAPNVVDVVPVMVLEEDGDDQTDQQQQQQEGDKVPYELIGVPKLMSNETRATMEEGSDDPQQNAGMEKRSADGLSAEEELELEQFVAKLLEGRTAGNAEMSELNGRQLSRLVQFIRQLQGILQVEAVQGAAEEVGEMDESEPDQQLLLLKKDSEQFDNADMGLANTVHKIVKGGIQRVEGNRVYVKVAKEQLTEQELYKLINYLDKKIALPNNLYFDEFLYEDGQLSFRISRLPTALQQAPVRKDKKRAADAAPQLDNASGVAQAVYKRRKDIQTLAGVRVDETGIGSGLDVVPVERSQRDWLFVPIMAVCALTICTLVTVLAVNLVRLKRHRRDGPLLPQVMPTTGAIDGGKKAASALYEDLCRQRESGKDGPQGVAVIGAGERSKHSSTSSWPGDDITAAQADQLDIGTGHMLLSFLKEHLEKPGAITNEWESVKDYVNRGGETTVAERAENVAKNADPGVVPYDDSLVQLHDADSSGAIVTVASSAGDGYINASKIYDADPEPAYIAAQAPQPNTVDSFWQMIWEQGIALLVNLCDQEETKSGRYAQYWPEEGSRVFGMFEVHLVSEHIWSEHYVVRSLYLKNSATGETRTVTQFHFLTWPGNDKRAVPASKKALLEFRRKVNKSYRGRASPVLVHCWNGAGRTGCYCLIDLVINRIQKGVKEVNIAASLEHLRDQRMGMVESEEQFKCAFSCLAEEVSALLKGLQQPH